MMLAEAYGNIHIGLAFGGAAIGIGIASAGGVIAMSRNPGPVSYTHLDVYKRQRPP